jgi:hypothetical protein
MMGKGALLAMNCLGVGGLPDSRSHSECSVQTNTNESSHLVLFPPSAVPTLALSSKYLKFHFNEF